MDRYKASGDDTLSTYFLQQLKASGMDMSHPIIVSAREPAKEGEKESAAPVTGRLPNILVLGILALVTSITFRL